MRNNVLIYAASLLIFAGIVMLIKRRSFHQFRTIVLADRRAVFVGLIAAVVVGAVGVIDAPSATIQNVVSVIVGSVLFFLLASVFVHYVLRPRRSEL
jgi:drug/metabolite transporter (DMT)-like permease